MKEVTLSIIIPNYNSGHLLDLSLASIYSIESSFSFEVLIMDNLSTDNPLQYIRNYSKENLFFFSEKDNGIYDAMNKGIVKAKGDWIYFLGSGDHIVLNNIDRVLNKREIFSGIIYGNVNYVNSRLSVNGEFDLFRILRINLCHQSILFSKIIFQELGKFSLNYPILSDYHFNLRIFFQKNITKDYQNFLLCHYRGGGVSELIRDKAFNDNKNEIIFKLLFLNFNFDSLYSVMLFYYKYFINKIRLINSKLKL